MAAKVGSVPFSKSLEVELTVASVAAASAPTQVFTVKGLRPEWVVTVQSPDLAADGVGIGQAWVSDANELSIQFVNPTANPIVPGASVFFIFAH